MAAPSLLLQTGCASGRGEARGVDGRRRGLPPARPRAPVGNRAETGFRVPSRRGHGGSTARLPGPLAHPLHRRPPTSDSALYPTRSLTE
jgi:hypothetical protein